MNQLEVVTRIEEICEEFDSRVEVVGLAIARLELAKALAEAEAAQKDCLHLNYHINEFGKYCLDCHKLVTRKKA